VSRQPKTIPIATLETEIAVWLAAIPAATFDLRSQGHREAFTHLGTYLENYRRLRYRKAAPHDDPDPDPLDTDPPAGDPVPGGAPGRRGRASAGARARGRRLHGADGEGL